MSFYNSFPETVSVQDRISAMDAVIAKLDAEVNTLKRKTDNRKKLSPREVELIRRLASQGFSHRTLADSFDVNKSTVSRTVNNTYHKED
ncbi:helix-turn-helix domain-containing protein [Nocardia sp. NPDC059246]|uniref:helix-turn-helix domain-containing protein n=1 Tax=unclassified Nocardia TaxID=2637762 RepID=UPI0036A8E5FB